MDRVIKSFIDQQAARGITLDAVQQEALFSISAGRDVLVSAPTGSGKTMVALGAVELAFARSLRCVYTAPIKALSNQKYTEMCDIYGSEHIGLLTGDETINREAQILVVTTEVLRNMLYAHDATIEDIGYVVLDEVHYLADPARGPVWEEVIVLLPSNVRLVSLSATVANVDEFVQWLESVRADTALITSSERPVPLVQYVCAKGDFAPLFGDDGKHLSRRARTLLESVQEEAKENEYNRSLAHRRHYHQSRGAKQVGARERRSVIHVLQREKMLPAIEFIFSRKGCDRAVKDLLDADICLTTPSQERQISAALDELRAQLSDEDARTIRFSLWQKALRRGFGAHHAGMFPALKELTEKLMADGLLSIVYATGTLALGIDMPVRTVVVESLRRFNGTDFVDLSGTEYAQLIGRAGRRGKDTVGHAVVLATQDLRIDQLTQVASGELEPLRSAFFPSYNAVANLLRSSTYSEAREIMGSSFAQFQANSSVGRLEGRARRIRARVAKEEQRLRALCDHGDLVDYMRLRSSLTRASKAARKQAKIEYRRAIERSWRRAEIGHAYAYATHGSVHYGVVLSTHRDRIRLVCDDTRLHWLRRTELTSQLRDVGTVTMPFGLSFKAPEVREQLAEDLFDLVAERIDLGLDRDLTGSWAQAAKREDPRLVNHPVNSCPDLPQHLRQAHDLMQLDAELTAVENEVNSAVDSVAHEFDATASVLERLGYLQRMHTDLSVKVKLSENALVLCAIHNECDLLITQCLLDPSFAELTPAEFAAICTCFLGDRRLGERHLADRRRETRRNLQRAENAGRSDETSTFLSPALSAAWAAIERSFEFLDKEELRAGISRTPEPRAGGIIPFYEWASGGSLAQILRKARLDVGDFMAANRRLADLLGQIAAAASHSVVADKAAEALVLIRRWEWL